MNARGLWVLLGALGLAAFATMKHFTNLLPVQRIRSDRMGSGHYGAPRGKRVHNGIDLVADPLDVITSPVNGRVVKFPTVYRDTPEFRGIDIEGEGYIFRIFYALPVAGLRIGSEVRRGQPIGVAQDIAAHHGGGMVNHIHVEARRVVGGELLDLEQWLSLA